MYIRRRPFVAVRLVRRIFYLRSGFKKRCVTALLRAAQLDERKFAIVGLLWCALFRAIFLWQIFFLERLASLANVVFAVVRPLRHGFERSTLLRVHFAALREGGGLP